MTTLVLWDIDLTLLDLRRLGALWFRRALHEVTGHELAALPPFAGRTDRWIAQELLAAVGLTVTEDLVERLHAAAVRHAAAERDRIAELGFVLPGVPAVLRALAGRPGVTQSLVTGNLAPIAGYKVAAFGLAEYLELEIGGYGGVSAERAELVADALAKARARYGEPISPVVIGDTPHDVTAALAHGVRAVGVCTGRFTAGELTAAGAHVVLPDLADTATALAAVTGF